MSERTSRHGAQLVETRRRGAGRTLAAG